MKKSKTLVIFIAVMMMLSVLQVTAAPVAAAGPTVTFETNGGSAVEPLEGVRSIRRGPVTDRGSGYRFAGCYTSPMFSGSRVVFPYIVTQDTTLYAKWNTPTVFAPAFAAQGVAVLDEDLNLWGTFAAGYPGLEEYSLLTAIGLHDREILALDIGMQGLFAYDIGAYPPTSAGFGDNVGSGANSLVIDRDYAYVIISSSDQVRVIDLSKTADKIGNDRLVTTIPTRIGTGTATMNPTFGVMLDDKLYVSLSGVTAGDPENNQLLEINVRGIDPSLPPSTQQVLATRTLTFPPGELVNDHPAGVQNYATPQGLAAANGKLYVTLGNLGLVSVPVPVGPGYMAVVDPVTWTKTLYVLPPNCRYPRQVLATDTRIYVTCVGNYSIEDPPLAALVVLDADTMALINTTTFPPSLKDGTDNRPSNDTAAAPGRMTIVGNRLVIADERTNRLFVTDLDGNVPSGFAEGIALCKFEYYTPTEGYQSVLDIVSLPYPIAAGAIYVTTPATGATQGTLASPPPEATYTSGPVSWSPAAATFAGGVYYTASVTLTAKPGYTFKDHSVAVVNEQLATVTANTGATLTLSYTFPATAMSGTYLDYDSSTNAFTAKPVPSPITVLTDAITTLDGAVTNGWYAVNGTLNMNTRLRVSGDVKLLLADDCLLEATRGIQVGAGDKLTIYAQSANTAGTGRLTASTGVYQAGIGGGDGSSGSNGTCGEITINGGVVTASGGAYAAGIGSYYNYPGGTIRINGGVVTATGGSSSAGIGSGTGGVGGNIAIYGGTASATGGAGGVGIGSGVGVAEGSITIQGGNVTARSDAQALRGNITSLPDIYAWWANVEQADPGDAGSAYPGKVFVNSSTYKYARISTTNVPGSSVIKGDVNGDGQKNMQDVLLIYQYFRSKTTLTGEGVIAADVNNDGKVNMTDVLLVYQYFRGKAASL